MKCVFCEKEVEKPNFYSLKDGRVSIVCKSCLVKFKEFIEGWVNLDRE